MKIHIWQQFASNHSNSFTVVGAVPTVEDAQLAADALKKLRDEILEQTGDDRNRRTLVPAEIRAANRFGLTNWHKPLEMVGSLRFVDNHLILTNFRDTYQGCHVLPDLLNKMGATNVYAEEEYGKECIVLNLKFTAPDDDTADRLYVEWKLYLTYGQHEVEFDAYIPWIIYVEGERHPNAERFIELYKRQCIEKLRKNYWYEHMMRGLEQLRQQPDTQNNPLLLARIEQEISVLTTETPPVPLTPDEKKLVGFSSFYFSVHPDDNFNFQRNGLSFVVSGLRLLDMGVGLPVILQWLDEEMGCTDIEYSFEMVRCGDDE